MSDKRGSVGEALEACRLFNKHAANLLAHDDCSAEERSEIGEAFSLAFAVAAKNFENEERYK